MKRNIRFTFLINDQELAMINKLAKHLQRTPSDAIRFELRKYARELGLVQFTPEAEPSNELTKEQIEIEQSDTVKVS